VTQAHLRHLDQEELNRAVDGASTRLNGDQLAWVRTDPDVDTSPLVSGTAARWAYLVRVDAIDRDEGAPNLW